MAALAAVVPLRPKDLNEQRAAAPAIPEPAKLYCLIVIALFLHQPDDKPDADNCRQCHQPWPCSQMRLAYRLREGF